jgi:hypothetical protein
MTSEKLEILKKLRQLEFFIKDGKYGVRTYSLSPIRVHSRKLDSVEAVLVYAQTVINECGGRTHEIGSVNEFVTAHLSEGSTCIIEFLCVPELCEKFLLEHGHATSLSELSNLLTSK